jgi:hypothetical protein
MDMKDPWSAKLLVVATQQLHASRLYERYSDHDCFLIRTPKLDEPAVAVLMGYGGETYGLNVFLGPSAMATYQSLCGAGSEGQARRAMMRSHMIGYQMSDAVDLPHDARLWLKKAKIRPSSDQLYPMPMSIEPGKVLSATLKDSETRLLLHLVRGILAAAQDKAFKPCGVDQRGQVLCVQLNEDAEHPKASVTWERCASESSSKRSADVQPAVARFDLAGLEASDDNWLVSLVPVPGSIQGDDRQPHMLIVCSERSQSLYPSLLMEIAPADLVDALARLMRGELDQPEDPSIELTPPPVGLPARMAFDTTSLRDAVRDAFEPLGVQCIDGSDDPGLQAMFDDIYTSFGAHVLEGEDDGFLQDGRSPEADDLDGWKQVDGWLKDMIHEGFDHDDRYLGARALKRYFGPDADPLALFAKFRQLMVIDSYAQWFAISYRSTRSKPTLAEQWLNDPSVPIAVKTLLSAVLAQAPSIYRIDDVDEDTGKITFADLLTDDVTIVTDFALSTCLDPGWLFPARLVPAGDFHFVFPAGPVLAGFQMSAAMRLLDDHKISASPAKLHDQPHLLGHLWAVLDRYDQQTLDLRNTDGHALVPHTATFACSNRPALERFLAEHPDYEPDGDDPDAWVWFRRGTEASDRNATGTHIVEARCNTSAGSATLLGQIELHSGRFTLTTNSRERFDTARAALEQVNGVRLTSVEAQPLTNLANATKPDDDILTQPEDDSFVLDEAMLDAAREYLTNHYRQWLDYPLPALRGKTPRQAAKDPKLRQQLAALIRAMPDPANLSDGSIQINAPRQMLLAELGLD